LAKNRLFVAVVHKDKGSSYGVEFPDMPGCFSAGGTQDEAVTNAAEALRMHAEALIQSGAAVPQARALDDVVADKALRRRVGNAPLVVVPLLLDDGRSRRINISLDAGLVDAIDGAAEARGVTRSAFLAQAAREKIGAQR
jgi:predicted RNase H-like HicB family nuclease